MPEEAWTICDVSATVYSAVLTHFTFVGFYLSALSAKQSLYSTPVTANLLCNQFNKCHLHHIAFHIAF